MEDILGREVKENDLVIGMTIGRHSDGIRFGVFNGSTVNWRCGTVSTTSNMYLIENPTEKEQGIKQSIIDKVKAAKERDEEAKAKRRELKRIPTKDLVVGESYEDDRKYTYVYLGKGSVYDSHTNCTEHGYLYLSGYNGHYNADTDSFYYLPTVHTLKNPKKLVKVTEREKIGYTFDKQEFTLRQTVRESSSVYGYGWSQRERFLRFKLGGSQ